MELTQAAKAARNEYMRKYREEKKDKMKIYYKQYREEHKEEIKAASARYWERKAAGNEGE